jgi:hypothetical protein
MDSVPSQDYFCCSHCDDYVLESIFRRHMISRMVRRTGFKPNIARGMKERSASGEVSDFSSDSDSEHAPSTTDDYQDQGM